MARRRASIVVVSMSFGTWRREKGSCVRKEAARRGKVAFLAPLIGICPKRACPPCMTKAVMMRFCGVSF